MTRATDRATRRRRGIRPRPGRDRAQARRRRTSRPASAGPRAQCPPSEGRR